MKRLLHGTLAIGTLAIFMIILLVGCQEDGQPNAVNSLEDVEGKMIGALRGTPSARLADELGAARVFYSGEELIGGLIAGTVDCAILESAIANELVTATSGARILNDALIEYDLRFAVPRENAELLDVVNSALAALNANGTLRNLRDKYFSGKSYTYVPPEGVEQRVGDLTLAITSDSSPYSYRDENGEYTGLDIEVARAVCDYLGVELKIIEEDASELITAVWFGRANLAAGWLPDDIDEQVSITDAYANSVLVIVVRK